MTFEAQPESQPKRIEINPLNPDASHLPVHLAAHEDRFVHPDTGIILSLPKLAPGDVVQLPMEGRESKVAHYLVVPESDNEPRERLLLQPLVPNEVEQLKTQKSLFPDVIINFTTPTSQGHAF